MQRKFLFAMKSTNESTHVIRDDCNQRYVIEQVEDRLEILELDLRKEVKIRGINQLHQRAGE